jgi:hypothetical protein
MRNLLVLLVVLGMATAANATLQISVHTNPPGGETWDPMNPQDTEIEIGPSEFLVLDIWTDALIDKDVAESWFNGWALVCDRATATIEGGADQTQIPGIVIYPGASGSGHPGVDPGVDEGVWGAATPSGSSIEAGGVLYSEILLHCEIVDGDAVLRLLSTSDWMNANLEDMVVIHQTPEPMTLGLLGLGGLGLLRRRR